MIIKYFRMFRNVENIPDLFENKLKCSYLFENILVVQNKFLNEKSLQKRSANISDCLDENV